MSKSKIVVFVGPTLARSKAKKLLPNAEYRPPAVQGDILKSALLSPDVIVLIDGYFERIPAVYHKEILWALQNGISVCGAASMGALRAAELQQFGMIGIGEIFESFSCGELERDDEVALVHAPPNAQYKTLSEPLVNIRWTLSAAVNAGIIDEKLKDRIIEVGKGMFYPDRSYESLLGHRNLSNYSEQIEKLADWLPIGHIDQKERDAIACLKVVAENKLAYPIATEFSFNHTDAFESLLLEIQKNICANGDRNLSYDDTLNLLRQLSSDSYDACEMEASIDELALSIDRFVNEPLSDALLASQVAAFKQEHSIVDSESLYKWLAARDIDIDTLSKWLEEVARIRRVQSGLADKVRDRMQINFKLRGNSNRGMP